MVQNEIERIKKTESEALHLLETERNAAGAEIRRAEAEAEALMLRKQEEAKETVLKMQVAAEEAAIAEAERIREGGEENVERIRTRVPRTVPSGGRLIVRKVLGESDALSATDEAGDYRPASRVSE